MARSRGRPSRGSGARADADAADAAGAAAGRARRPLRLCLAIAAFVLAVTADERTLGLVTDEQQMLSTAASLARFGEIGIARGHYFAVHRPGGDAVSPYGMGLPLLEVPVVWAARPWEAAFGARSSQSLFVLLQIGFVLAACAGAGLLARTLGASPGGEAVAVLGTLFSPLWPSVSSLFSEPLQAAVLVLAVLCGARAARERAGRRALLLAAAAGALAAWAVVTKPLNLVSAPFLLAPLLLDAAAPDARLRRERLRLLGAALGAAAAVAVLWVTLEIVRFGRPLTAYSGQGFTHSLVDGLWRLTVGVNKGLVWYVPLAALGVWGLVRLARARETRGTAVASASVVVGLLVVTSLWWAWDGTVGWGPRLLLPAIPLLAAAAGAALREGGRAVRVAAVLVALGGAVNLLGALQSEQGYFGYVDASGLEPARPEDVGSMPPYFLQKGPGGAPHVGRIYVAASRPEFAPIRVHLFLLRARLAKESEAEIRQVLASPPWLSSRPDAVPRLTAPQATSFWIRENGLVTPFRWPHLFRVLRAEPSERLRSFNGAYDVVLGDQLGRALDLGKPERALALAEELYRLAPSGYAAAHVAEALRAAGRPDASSAFLAGLPPNERATPFVRVVEALLARDRGDHDAARSLLASAARAMRTQGLLEALRTDPREWQGLRPLTTGLLSLETLEKPGARWAS